MTLDVETQLVQLTMVRVGQLLAFGIMWHISRSYLPAREWAVGAGVAILGLLAALVLRDLAPPIVVSLAFNGFILLGWLIFDAGIVRAAGYPIPWHEGVGIALASGVGIGVVAVLLPDQIGWRIFLFHLATIAFDLYTFRCCVTPKDGVRSPSLTIVGSALLVICVSGIFRVGLSFDPAVTSVFDAQPFNLQFLLVSTPLLLVVSVLLTVQATESSQRELGRQARRDPLTGVLNRRGFDELASREWARARRNGQPIGVLAIDVDEFKLVNDRHGHHVGDIALQQIVDRIRTLLRPEDLLGRMGGDEFLALLPGSSVEQAMMVAERIRVAVGHLPTTQIGLPRIGVSVGVTSVVVATLSGDVQWEAALKDADLALYAAKREGRDRVVKAAPLIAASG